MFLIERNNHVKQTMIISKGGQKAGYYATIGSQLKCLSLLNSALHETEALFTLGARALLPGRGHKLVLRSDTGYS